MLHSRVVCAIMPTFRSPFSSCLTLAMAVSHVHELRASQPLAATGQSSAPLLTSTPHSSPKRSRRPPQRNLGSHCNRGSNHFVVRSYIERWQIQSHSRSVCMNNRLSARPDSVSFNSSYLYHYTS